MVESTHVTPAAAHGAYLEVKRVLREVARGPVLRSASTRQVNVHVHPVRVVLSLQQ